MKTVKYLLGLAALVLCAVLVLCACGGQPQQTNPAATPDATADSTTALYTVTVCDALGQPCTEGIIVRFMKDGQQAAMQVVGADGTAAKELERGEYTVELQFTDSEASYVATALTLTAEVTEGKVELAAVPAESREVFADGQNCTAWIVAPGCTAVELTGGRNYFLFTTDTPGSYEFSVVGAEGVVMGYYGAPHFIQSQSAVDVVDNKFTLSIKNNMLGENSLWVIGMDGEGPCTLCICRTGDPAWGVEDEPWTVYQPTVDVVPYTLPEGSTIGEFDLTAPTDTYTLVYNEADGFYHLNTADGPLVLVRLGAGTDYLDPISVVTDKSSVCKYFYDENGNFVKKESYNECLFRYIECMDEGSGLYPLTEDLKYIIQNRGEYYGWFDPENTHCYLFVNANLEPIPGINNELGWLFACCYIAE